MHWGAMCEVWPLQWRHDGHDGVLNHQPHDCLRNHLFWCWSKKTSKLRVTGLCAENSPMTGEFPTQKASNAEYVSIWWRHHGITINWTRCVTMHCQQLQGGENLSDASHVPMVTCGLIVFPMALWMQNLQIIFDFTSLDIFLWHISKYLPMTTNKLIENSNWLLFLQLMAFWIYYWRV